MTFEEPKGYKEVKPVDNAQMDWEKSYKHPRKKFEVRYAVRPMDEELKTYEASKNNSTASMVDPNTCAPSLMQVTLLNISGRMPDPNVFGSEAVKTEFNADWGASGAVPVGTWAQGYKYCLMVLLHKNDYGQGYVFYLGDDLETIHKEMKSIFHNLKFDPQVMTRK
ncbi:MAG TPA: hypothetical protein VK177_00580 [Flavobacteriales bacterium]|nr:hypothetical protein [Flavobacteriales bacterium]